jgi:hypothetical protein
VIGHRLLVAHIFTLPNLLTGSMTRRRTSAHNMATDATGRGSTASLSEEEAMATYYIMERDHAQRDEDLANGIYRHNIHHSQKGYPKAGSSQSICKYLPTFFTQTSDPLHAVECQIRFVRWATVSPRCENYFLYNAFWLFTLTDCPYLWLVQVMMSWRYNQSPI